MYVVLFDDELEEELLESSLSSESELELSLEELVVVSSTDFCRQIKQIIIK